MRVLLLIGAVLGFIESGAQKKILKQAFAYESAGLHEQAAESFMEALYKDATKAESIKGLERNAQKVIDDKLSEYFILRNSEELEKAVAQFESVISYQQRLSYFNVKTNIPGYYYEDFENDKSRLEKLAKEGDKKTQENQLNELYEKAVRHYETKQYKKAWLDFDSVQRIDPSYKEAVQYLELIEEKAMTIAIVPDQISRLMVDESLRSQLVAEISNLNNPLIRMVSRDNLEKLIEEQKLGLSGIIDEKTAAQLGKLMGVKGMLITKVINQNFVEAQKIQQAKTAYTSSKSKVYNQTTQQTEYQTNYQPVSYNEFSQKNRFILSVQYQLIAVETAEILKADVVDYVFEDVLNYAEYQGDYRSLYPSDGSSIYTKGIERNTFLELFTANRNVLSKKEIEFEATKKLSQKMANSIDNFFE